VRDFAALRVDALQSVLEIFKHLQLRLSWVNGSTSYHLKSG
jgi:hypothetical protein